MAITIRVYDANKDGKGIDFSAYLKNYNKTYLRDGYGGFNSSDPMAMSGTQYATTNKKDYGAVLTSGKTKWSYDLATHKVTGSLATVQFGNKVALNSKNKFELVQDIQISGIGVTDKVLGGQILADIMGGKNTDGGATTSLVNVLKQNAINFVGSKGSDAFTGYGKADKISGGDGNDTLRGGAGNDKIYGGTGNDKLYGDDGVDTVKGGKGNDTIYGGNGNDKLYGEDGVDTIKGGKGDDTIYGGNDNDKLYGNDGNDTVKGGAGNDRIYGDNGNDKLYGEAGNDTIYGGAGNDTIYGGKGDDTLTGGKGNDIFVFNKNEGKDTIKDFSAGSGKGDVIHLDDALLKNFADVKAHAVDTAKGVLIEYGNGSILLAGVEKFDLHENDFFFF